CTQSKPTAKPQPRRQTMKLHLICHGMMLFWYRKPANGPDGYTIFIPHGHSHDGSGTMLHDVRLGLGAGAKDSVLKLPADHADHTRKNYRLEFGASANMNPRSQSPPASQNLSFYETRDNK